MSAVAVAVHRLPHARDLPLPAVATAGAAGVDLHAAVTETVGLKPGHRTLVPTGLVLMLPPGYEGQIRPRSGLALHHGVTVLNAPGTVDADYRGEVGVVLINLGREMFRIERGQRIAQLIVAPVSAVAWREMGHVPEGVGRGALGFGSTG